MAVSDYSLRHSSGPSASFPHVYFAVTKVTYPINQQLLKMPRPNADQRIRRRATRDRKITVLGIAALTGKSAADTELGIDTGAGISDVGGRRILEALEAAAQTWKNSGTVTLYLGKKSDGSDNTFTGIIENVTFDWQPDPDDANDVRGFTLNFIVATVT